MPPEEKRTAQNTSNNAANFNPRHGYDQRGQTIHGPQTNIAGSISIYNGPVYQGPAYPRRRYDQDIADIIRFYTQTFVGRSAEVAQILNFARQSEAGYLLVEAPAGYGKSALVTHLIDQHIRGLWDVNSAPILLYFFIRQERNETSPVAFLQAVNAQLLEQLQIPGGTPPDLPSLHNQFSELWGTVVATANRTQPLLLLVDGLDEGAGDVATIAKELPTFLNDYVHVIVTSRPNPEPAEQMPLTHPFRRAPKLRLNVFGVADVQALLDQQGLALDEAAMLALRIHGITKGEPLFVRFVSEEVMAKGNGVLEQLEANPPKDVRAYFAQQFKLLNTLAHGELIWEILGVLTVTLGGISQDELTELLKVPRRQVRMALEPLQRYLLGEEHYELMHLQLRKTVAAEFSDSEMETNRKRILAWCRTYQALEWPENTPNYVLTYYAQHLIAVDDTTALYALISKRWMELKLLRTQSHWTFAQDVDLAIQAASTQPVALLPLVRNCLLYATLGTLAISVPTEILRALTQVGEAEKAKGYVALLQEPTKKADALRVIAEELITSGHHTEAAELLRLAVTVAQSSTSAEENTIVLLNITKAMIQTGLIRDEAKELVVAVAATIEFRGDYFDLLNETKTACWVMILVGELKRGLAIAEQQLGTWLEVIRTVVEAQLYAGEIVLARHTALQGLDEALAMPADRKREQYICNAIIAASAVGEFQRAAEAVDAIEDPWTRARAQVSLAEALHRAGEPDPTEQHTYQALEIIHTIRDKEQAEYLEYRVAILLAQIGKFLQALSITQGLEHYWLKKEALTGIAQSLVAVGAFDKAIGIIRDGLAPNENSDAYVTLAQTLAEADLSHLALEVTQALPDPRERAIAFSRIAQAMAVKGEIAQARVLVQQSLTLVYTTANDWSILEAYNSIALALLDVGEIKRAQKIAHHVLAQLDTGSFEPSDISLAWIKAKLWSNALRILSSSGEVEQSRETVHRLLVYVQTINDDWTKADALRRVVYLLAETGQIDIAQSVVEQIGRDHIKSEALWELCRVQVNRQEFEAAMAIAQTIPDGTLWINALSVIIQGLVAAHLVNEAKAIATMSLTIIENSRDLHTDPEILSKAARSLLHCGDYSAADLVLTRAKALLLTVKSVELRAQSLISLAQVQASRGKNKKALKMLTQALKLSKKIVDKEVRSEILQQIAEALVALGEIVQAGETAVQAYDMALTLPNLNERMERLSQLAQVLAPVDKLTYGLDQFRTEVIKARGLNRYNLLWVIAGGAKLLAIVDRGQMLWWIYEAMLEIDEWWSVSD